jgi:uncharacterized protein (DUF885 family)
LTEDDYLDRQVILANLERSIAEYESLRPWERDPSRYAEAVIQGVYSLVERDYAPLEQRMAAVLQRLRRSPALLEQACANLTDQTPKLLAGIALQQIAGGIRFLQRVIPELAEQVPALEPELLEAHQHALHALTQYEEFVKGLKARGRDDFAVGRGYYEFLLQDYHQVNWDSRQLLELGQRSIPKFLGQLEAVAEEIAPGKSWVEIATELKRDHPSNEGLLEMYQREVDLAKAFVLEKDLVTVPEDEGFSVIWTPPFMWATIPYGSTHPPRPFEAGNEGFWKITPADPEASPEAQEQRLQGHNRWNARAIALHEGYPGHHMHFCVVKRLPSKVRRQFKDTVFVEGWGLYTEELMWEAGYFDDLRVRLIQLVNALWRAVRVVVDVSMHTRQMPLTEAIDMLVDVSRLERVNAITEATRYAATPTQASSYLLGKTLIMELREAYRAQVGAAFDLKTFHDQLLSYGAISPLLVRERMIGG